MTNTSATGPTLSKTAQSAFKRHFSQGNASNGDDSKHLLQIKSVAHAVFGPKTPQEKINERLELLERRIMAPPPQDIRRNSGESSLGTHSNSITSINFVNDTGNSSLQGQTASTMNGERSMIALVAAHQSTGSQHSFSFGNNTDTPTHRNSASPSLKQVERITEYHIERMKENLSNQHHDSDRSAGASILSATATNRSSHSMSSNQTLITAHVRQRAKSLDVVVAESPPTAASEKIEKNQCSSNEVRALNTASDVDQSITPSSSSKRKSSVPTKLQDLVVDRKRRKGGAAKPMLSTLDENAKSTYPMSPIITSNAATDGNQSSSRGASNPGRTKSKTPSHNGSIEIHTKPSPANMLITKFFRTSGNIKGDLDSKHTVKTDDQTTEKRNKTKSVSVDHDLSKQIDNLNSVIANLTDLLEEKSSQLKAVSNNQTIVHAQLRSQLQEREKEISCLKEEMMNRELRKDQVIEEFVRQEAIRASVELRQKLASDGARLGRWVSTRVGMRVEPVWEDGHAYLKLKEKRHELKRKRDILEERSKLNLKHEIDGNKDIDRLEQEEFNASLQLHRNELEREEEEYKKEEAALLIEKNTHKMALKQIANEDSSRFSQRPKVSMVRSFLINVHSKARYV